MRPVTVRVLVAVSIILALMAAFSSHQPEYVGSVPRVDALSQKTVTSHGAIIDSSQSKFGGASAFFAPSTYVAVTDHPDFAFGTGDFTIDFWIRWKTLPDSSSGWSVNFYSQATDGQNYDLWQVNPWSAPTYSYQFYVNTLTEARPATHWQLSPGLSTGTWYHMAVVRSGDSWYMFQNGVQCGSTVTSSGPVPDYTGDVMISGFLGSGSSIDAWYDEFRISSVARWTSGFTPPTSLYTTDASTVLLIHFDSDFSDSSTTTSTSAAINVGNMDTTYNRLHTGYLYAQKFTTPLSNPTLGPLQSITFRAGENGFVTVALYSSDSNANAPLHPLTSPQTVAVSGVAYQAPKWVTVTMTAGNQIQINQLTDYWIVFAFQTDYGVCYSGEGGYRAWKGSLSNPWVYGTPFPDPWGSSSGADTYYQAEVYFTYAATQTGTITPTTSACSLSLPATIYRGTKWDWVVNTEDACVQYQQNQADVQAFYPWPDMVAQWLVDKFGASQYMSQRMTLELIAGSGIGAYSSPYGIGLTIGMFTIVRYGVKGGYASQLIAHEMANNYMTTAGGDYPPDWWADTVSPFPAATANLLEIDLNWGSSRTMGNAEVNSCHQSPPIDPIACPLINMFYDQLYGQYGTGMFANAFAAMRSDGIWFRDVGGPIGAVSALRTNYVAAYLFIGANTDLSSILSGRVPNFDRQTTLDIKQARTNLQSLPRTDNRWDEYLHGNYADALIITTTTSSVSTSMTTTSSASTGAIWGIYGAVYWRDQYGNLHLISWAQVTADSETGITAVTASTNGSYALWLTPGAYQVTAESGPAFWPQSKTATVPPVGRVRVDFELQPTCTTCTVTTTLSQSTTTAGTTATETSTLISTTAGLQMQVVSNSTVTSLIFDSTRGILNFTVSGPQGTFGFFDATVAKTLLSGQPVVLIDGVQTSATVSADTNFWYIHVTYAHSQHHVTIGGSNTVPELSSLPTLAIILTLAVIIFRRRQKR